MAQPRLFKLIRHQDVTGVSGEGHVADGVEFVDGTVVLRWFGDYASTVVWDDLATAMHVHGHDGRTRVEWADGHNDPDLIVLRRIDPGPGWVTGDRVNLMTQLNEFDLSPEEAREFAAQYASAADIADAATA